MPNQRLLRPPSRASGSRSWFLKTSNSVASVAKVIALRNGSLPTLPRAMAENISSVVRRSLKKLSSVPKNRLIPASSAIPVISSTRRWELRCRNVYWLYPGMGQYGQWNLQPRVVIMARMPP